jgi:hypothetical protein
LLSVFVIGPTLPPVATAFPPAAEDVEPDVAPDVEPELAVAPLLLFEVLVFVVVLGGGVVDGGTTLHSYSWPLNSASCPSASPYVPEVLEGTTTRSAKGSEQFQAKAGTDSASPNNNIAMRFIVSSSKLDCEVH